MTLQELLDMQMNKTEYDDGHLITRVPGGWFYEPGNLVTVGNFCQAPGFYSSGKKMFVAEPKN